ncbi:MAG: hypothetical protein N2235_10610 [Fischerella sp.]|nr:hypothetical protein [Fischerella sp.]
MSYQPIEIKSLQPLKDFVIVADMNFQERFTFGGILLPGDDGKSAGIRPRWARVYAVGPEQKDVKVGQFVCVAHGRWTRGVKIKDHTGVHVIRRVDTNDILLVSDEPVTDDTLSSAL